MKRFAAIMLLLQGLIGCQSHDSVTDYCAEKMSSMAYFELIKSKDYRDCVIEQRKRYSSQGVVR